MALILKSPTSDGFPMWKGRKVLEYRRNESSPITFGQRAVPRWRNGTNWR